MGAAVTVHHLQNQIESYEFSGWSQRGVWAGARNVLSDIKIKERIVTYLDTGQLLMLIFNAVIIHSNN